MSCSFPGRSVLGRGVLLAAALAVSGSQALALPVRVALDWPSGRPASALARARIKALRTAGLTAGGVPVEAEAGPDGVVLDLDDGVWQVQAEALGYWSQGAEVAVGRQAPASVRLALWPASSLHGEILTAGGDPLPRDVEVRLSAVVPAPAGEIDCLAGARPAAGAEPVARGAALPDRRGNLELPGSGRPVRRAAFGRGLRPALRVGGESQGRSEHRSRPDRAAPSGVGLRACGSEGRFEPTRSLSRDPAGGRDAARLARSPIQRRARRRGEPLRVPQPTWLLSFRRRAARRADCWPSSVRRRAPSASCACRRTARPGSIPRCCSKS